MSIFKNPFRKDSKLKLTGEDLIEAGVCPNCWGKQQWEGKFIQFEKDRERDVINNNRESQKAFIQKFVEDRVDGIRLINDGHIKVCSFCKTKYSI